jgi:transposase-like protein
VRKIRRPGPLPDVRVVRAECSGCGSSHSLIPSFLAPRSPYPQQVREEAVQHVAYGQSLNSLSASLGVPRVTIQRWVRDRRLREPRVVAAVRALLAHLNEELHGDLEELVARAGRALRFDPLCNLLASQVNVLLGLAQTLGCLLPGVLLL